jgi:hypothetical protein
MVVIKRVFSGATAYKRERDMYDYVKQKGVGDLFLNLIDYDDEKKVLVLDRGKCDL